MTDYPLLCIRGTACTSTGGRQTEQRGWFCPVCEDRLRDHLNAIAERWPALCIAVTSVEAITGVQGRQKRGGKAHGLRVNLDAIEAKKRAEEHLTFMARDLMDRFDEEGRELRLPDDTSPPGLAAWVAAWHLSAFTTHPGDDLALEIWDDTADIARRIGRAIAPRRVRVDTGIACEQHGTSDTGERVPCEGRLRAVVVGAQTPDLVCSLDPDHKVASADWMRSSWQRRASRNLDPRGVTALMRQVQVRHTSESG